MSRTSVSLSLCSSFCWFSLCDWFHLLRVLLWFLASKLSARIQLINPDLLLIRNVCAVVVPRKHSGLKVRMTNWKYNGASAFQQRPLFFQGFTLEGFEASGGFRQFRSVRGLFKTQQESFNLNLFLHLTCQLPPSFYLPISYSLSGWPPELLLGFFSVSQQVWQDEVPVIMTNYTHDTSRIHPPVTNRAPWHVSVHDQTLSETSLKVIIKMYHSIYN